ncbi:MAG: VanZ family protein [Pseudomonadota bacterium]
MRPLRFTKLWLALGWLVVGTVIYLSLTPHPVNLSISYGDKVGHFVSYALLMGWFVQIYQSRLMLVFHALFFIATGVVLEYLQSYYGRYFEYADMAANTGGVLLGLLLLLTPWKLLLLRWERRFFPAP